MNKIIDKTQCTHVKLDFKFMYIYQKKMLENGLVVNMPLLNNMVTNF